MTVWQFDGIRWHGPVSAVALASGVVSGPALYRDWFTIAVIAGVARPVRVA